MSSKIMLIGLGDLGSISLELLAREPAVGEIVVAGRSIRHSTARCHLALMGALAQGYTPTIRFIPLDLAHREATAEAIYREQPDLIYSTATMQTWWYPDLLPSQQARFWILGDILVIPEPFPWPTAMSIGDVLLAVGVFLFIVRATRSYNGSE